VNSTQFRADSARNRGVVVKSSPNPRVFLFATTCSVIYSLHPRPISLSVRSLRRILADPAPLLPTLGPFHCLCPQSHPSGMAFVHVEPDVDRRQQPTNITPFRRFLQHRHSRGIVHSPPQLLRESRTANGEEGFGQCA